jgi:hypothetical protein
MKEEVVVKTCDICKQKVEMFCDEQGYDAYVNISIQKTGAYSGESFDICLKCNAKIINFIDSLDLSDKHF